MAKCVYPYCKDGEAKNYYRIPEGGELRKKWMSAIPQVLGLSMDSLKKRSFLCSRHFSSNCYDHDADGNRRGLKANAIPTLFFVPTKTNPSMPSDGDSEEEADGPPPPGVLTLQSHYELFLRVRSQEMKLLVCKEKLQREEENIAKIQEKIRNSETGEMPEEVAEVYSKVMKKMRPIAPKKPPKKRPRTMEEVLVHLRKEKSVSEEALLVLFYLFADLPTDDSNVPANKDGMQCFAQYMTFYNTEVFENIPEMFDLTLPPIASVRQLFKKGNGEPGWSEEAFQSLSEQVNKQGEGDKLVCSLLVAEMGLKRKEEWDGRKMRGYVDCGPETNNMYDMDADGLPSARSVLAFMVVPLDPKQLWRIPVAYFFVNRLTGAEKANVIRECILRLHSFGAVVLSVTCNVFSCDKILLDALGVSIDLLPYIRPYFVHPADPLLRVHVIFDCCSLLISVRNMWATSQGFKDAEGRDISWKFVSELMKLQETQAASFNQTYDIPQWSWDSPYIKNRLLSQLFSESTANAMEYCYSELKLSQFEECAGTVHFIRMMSNVSKLLKSRRFLKKRTNGEDVAKMKSVYLEVIEYLYHLKDTKNQALHSANSGSIRFLYETLMSCQELLRQVPGFSAHCVSLDEAELLFFNIKSYTGWGSFPTARQFTYAFTAHVEKYGYCTSWNCAQTNSHWWLDSLDVSVARMEGRSVSKPEIVSPTIPVNFKSQLSCEHLLHSTEFSSLSEHNFIAILIVKTLASILHCDACLLALQDTHLSDNPLLILLRKTCGALICPSKDVLKVCACAEHHLQLALRTAKVCDKMSVFEWRNETFATRIGTTVMKDLLEKKREVFISLQQHLLDCAPDASHLYRLVRGISCCYVTMRLRRFKSWCHL